MRPSEVPGYWRWQTDFVSSITFKDALIRLTTNRTCARRDQEIAQQIAEKLHCARGTVIANGIGGDNVGKRLVVVYLNWYEYNVLTLCVTRAGTFEERGNHDLLADLYELNVSEDR